MLAVDGPVCPRDRGLDVAQGGIHPFEGGHFHGGGTGSRPYGLMGASRLDHGTEAFQPVADDGACRIEVPAGEHGDRLAGKPLHPVRFQADRFALGRCLDRGDERRLPRRAPAAFAAAPLAAHVRVVHFDAPGQRPDGVPLHHDLLELVLDAPGRGLLHAEAPAQLDAGNALLRLGHMIERAEPGPQRQFGRGEDRPGDGGGLPAAGGALEQVPALHQAVPLLPALGADEPVRPSRRDNAARHCSSVPYWRSNSGSLSPFWNWTMLRAIASSMKPPMFMVCTRRRMAEEEG